MKNSATVFTSKLKTTNEFRRRWFAWVCSCLVSRMIGSIRYRSVLIVYWSVLITLDRLIYVWLASHSPSMCGRGQHHQCKKRPLRQGQCESDAASMTFKGSKQKECIPVGCVPPAAAAISPATHAPSRPHTSPLPRMPPQPCMPPCHAHSPAMHSPCHTCRLLICTHADE